MLCFEIGWINYEKMLEIILYNYTDVWKVYNLYYNLLTIY